MLSPIEDLERLLNRIDMRISRLEMGMGLGPFSKDGRRHRRRKDDAEKQMDEPFIFSPAEAHSDRRSA